MYSMDLSFLINCLGYASLLVPHGTEVDGKKITLLNDLTLDDDGTIYFTDSSTKYLLNKIVYCAMEYENSGRFEFIYFCVLCSVLLFCFNLCLITNMYIKTMF